MICDHDLNAREVAVVADGYCPLCMEDEIARLRAENTKLGWHLETILQACDKPSCGWYSVFETTIDEARTALSQDKHG